MNVNVAATHSFQLDSITFIWHFTWLRRFMLHTNSVWRRLISLRETVFFSFLHWIHMSVSCQLDLSIHIKISWISSFDWFMKCLIFFSNFSSHKYYSTCINHLVNRHLAIFEWEISDLLWFMNVIVFPRKKSQWLTMNMLS